MKTDAPRSRRPYLGTLAVLALAWLAPHATVHAAQEYDPWRGRAAAPATDRVIVKLRPQATDRVQAQAAGDRVAALAQRTGLAFRAARNLYGDVHVVRLDALTTPATLDAKLATLRADAAVEYAEPDARMRAHAIPNDTLFTGTPGVAGRTGQWYMQAIQGTPVGQTTAATNAVAAWDVTTGAESVVVAILDTGVRFDHPDLLRVANGGKLLDGRDFVSTDSGGGTLTANDGDGWDADASDPGDWITAADKSNALFADCDEDASSWHGTRVSGIVGALSNNATGIAGFSWRSRLLPVRVLGKCGGYVSDIIAGMRWAAGLPLANVPTNPTPAKVLNLSLGGTADACSAAYQSAIDEVIARGALVVVSAGNEGTALDQPANCRGVVAVTAVRHAGTKVGFANLGVGTTIAAPGGNCVLVGPGDPCLFSIDTTTNLGSTVPAGNGYTDQTRINVGTSFSAPIVSGIAALVYAAHPTLTPAQASARLQAGARAFPTLATDETGTAVPACRVPRNSTEAQTAQCNCSKWTCGAGLADAGQTIGALTAPIAAIATSGVAGPGATVQLDGAGSSPGAGAGVATYAWSLRTGTGATFSAPSAVTTSLQLPTNSEIAVQLVVTDTRGGSHTATANVLGRVPNLVGLTQAAALAALANADFAVGFIDTAPSATAAAGTVLSQGRTPGEIAASGTPIAFTIATVQTTVATPNVVGQTQAAATTALQNAGLALGTVTTEASSTVANGNVISQNPAAGSNVPPGTTVSIVVSSGPPSSGFGGGGGGGGSLDLGTLAAAALVALYARRRRRGDTPG